MTHEDRVLALLFAADAPADPKKLAAALDLESPAVAGLLERLEAKLEAAGPIRLARLAGGVQLATKPEYAEDLARFLKPQRSRLSKPLMETLAVIAYRQPVTVNEIETVRGVGADHSVRALVERRLVEEKGRKQTPGRPVLYGTTDEFLHRFGMNGLADLPPENLFSPVPARVPSEP